jgi:hypothetical protein
MRSRPHHPATARLEAELSPTLTARLVARRPLYFEAPDHANDLPGHVRAGSGVRLWGGRIAVIQDDVHALALVDERTGMATPLLLPRGDDGRRIFGVAEGNKALKMDLEACVVLPDGRLVAFGSGSTDRRERIVVVGAGGDVAIHDGAAFYGELRARTDFSGSELNVEGAAIQGERLRLFQRGNGAPRDGLEPVNAIGTFPVAGFVAWLGGGALPLLEGVHQVDLGRVEGVPLGFTDAATLPDGRLAFLAGAEDSPDTYQDGAVVGCRLGVIDGDRIRTTDLIDENGERCLLKLEGLEYLGEAHGGGWRFAVVADQDDPTVPTLLGEVVLAER